MTLKALQITPADQLVISNLLSGVRMSDPDTLRNVREVRRRFDVKRADKKLAKLTRKLREFAIAEGIDWDDLLDSEDLLESAHNRRAVEDAELEQRKLDSLIEKISGLGEAREFTVDSAFLVWIQARLNGQNWEQVRRMEPDRKVVEIEVIVSVGQAEAIADFSDKLNAAIAAAGIQEARDVGKQQDVEKQGE